MLRPVKVKLLIRTIQLITTNPKSQKKKQNNRWQIMGTKGTSVRSLIRKKLSKNLKLKLIIQIKNKWRNRNPQILTIYTKTSASFSNPKNLQILNPVNVLS
jgi:hypothetical protein